MKKSNARIVAALLLAALLLPACSKGGSDTPDTSAPVTSGGDAVTTAPEETADPNARENHMDKLPADLNFGGETVTALFRGETSYLDGTEGNYWIRNDVCGSDNIGDIVSDAVWERNKTVEERLGVKLDWIASEGGSLNGDQQVIKSILTSQDSTYNFFLPTGNTSAETGLAVYMRDLSNAKYLDLSSPWWWEFANEAMSMDGKTKQFIVGDMLLTNLAQTCVLYFNKDIYTNVYGNPDDMYQLTLDGKLTQDKLYELSSGAYNDANGDGVKNEGDVFGILFSANTTEEMAGFVASCDLDLYERDADGNLTITMNNERTITAIEKLYRLLNENDGAWQRTGSIADQAKPFAEGSSLFLGARLISATTATMREMEQEYGILPMPKLDEAQQMYFSGVHNSGTNLCVPKLVDDKRFDTTGAVLEALCGEAHRTYMDAFLETAMKLKYSRDALSGQCIDLVVEGLTKNTLLEYPNNVASIMSTCIFTPIKSNPNAFATSFRKVGPAAQKQWDKAISDLAKSQE